MKKIKDEKLIDFDPNYPALLPEDWKDKTAPTVYEILATSNTLKRMYAEKVKEIESGKINNEAGEESLRKIATNYQSVKSLLFQPR
jgi:DNA-binding transcriptional regulator PaaX